MRVRHILFTSVLLTSLLSCKSQDANQIKVVNKETIQKEVIGKDVQLVDVRTPVEYNDGHIDDAININVSDPERFAEEIKKLDRDKPVYLYCKMGGRSQRASEQLQEMGFREIYNYSGGYDEWSKN